MTSFFHSERSEESYVLARKILHIYSGGRLAVLNLRIHVLYTELANYA